MITVKKFPFAAFLKIISDDMIAGLIGAMDYTTGDEIDASGQAVTDPEWLAFQPAIEAQARRMAARMNANLITYDASGNWVSGWCDTEITGL